MKNKKGNIIGNFLTIKTDSKKLTAPWKKNLEVIILDARISINRFYRYFYVCV